MKTLLVIDMQKVFERDALHVPEINKVKGNIVKLCRAFGDNTIFTEQLLDPNAQGTWKTFNKEFAYIEKDKINWEIIDELKPFAKNLIVKYTYSCFHSPEFKRLTEEQNRHSFVICGVKTDYCVLSTVMDAVDEGCPITVVVDAVAGEKKDVSDAVIDIFKRMPTQVELKTTDEVIKDLG